MLATLVLPPRGCICIVPSVMPASGQPCALGGFLGGHGLGGAGGFKWPRYRRWAGVHRWPHPAVMPRVALVLLPVSVDQQGW